MWKLFWVGVMSQSLFNITRNLLVIWPFFHAVGVMLDFAVNIGAVNDIVGDLPWALGAVVLMIVTSVGLVRVRRAQLADGGTPQAHSQPAAAPTPGGRDHSPA
jgi:hypothetical protein